jgi:hypothetical protein
MKRWVKMARECTGTVRKRNSKIYARVRFKDDTGKLRDFRRVADSKADASKKLNARAGFAVCKP